jgi:hypothetical protein
MAIWAGVTEISGLREAAEDLTLVFRLDFIKKDLTL